MMIKKKESRRIDKEKVKSWPHGTGILRWLFIRSHECKLS